MGYRFPKCRSARRARLFSDPKWLIVNISPASTIVTDLRYSTESTSQVLGNGLLTDPTLMNGVLLQILSCGSTEARDVVKASLPLP